MGQFLSIGKEFHVTLDDEIANEPFDVLRSSGIWDSGWKISTNSSVVKCVDGPSATKHILKQDQTEKTWRIFLDNGKV